MQTGRFHQDQSGTKLNMLTLIEKTDMKTANGSYKYRVRCDCGMEAVVAYNQMVRGHAKSCGCLNLRKGPDAPNFKHGLSDKNHPENKSYQRKKYDIHKYNLTPEQKLSIMEKQGGKCAICGYTFGQKVGDMHVDHCHTSGKVRGFLCDLCNRGLGYFRDSSSTLNRAADYLKEQNTLA